MRDCRICQLNSLVDNEDEEDDELIELSCCCKDDLALAHQHCADTWFKIKGNNYGGYGYGEVFKGLKDGEWCRSMARAAGDASADKVDHAVAMALRENRGSNYVRIQVWLSRIDGHMGLANSLALKIAGATNSMQDLVGETLQKCRWRNVDGGLMIDSAMKVLISRIPEVSVEERRQALDRASSYTLMKGVTTVVDVGRYFLGAPVEHS